MWPAVRPSTAPATSLNPFDDGKNLSGRVGADMKLGLGPNLTLEATVNPDFGQVEADPAEVNLTAFATRFAEKRPFFLEGSQLFTINHPNFYYSRRIGARPTRHGHGRLRRLPAGRHDPRGRQDHRPPALEDIGRRADGGDRRRSPRRWPSLGIRRHHRDPRGAARVLRPRPRPAGVRPARLDGRLSRQRDAPRRAGRRRRWRAS